MQQHLVALAVNLQLAEQLADTDLEAAKALLAEMSRDLKQALDETAQLAQRIYPPLLEACGLAATLRMAAASAGVRVSIEVPTLGSYPPAIERTVYLCCLEALRHAGAGAPAAIAVGEGTSGLTFEVSANGGGSNVELDRLRDRVEALGGELTIESEPGRGIRVSGSLPLER